MPYVISEVQAPDGSENSLHCNILGEDLKQIILLKINSLEIYRIDRHDRKVELKIHDVVSMEENIISACHCYMKELDRDIVVVMTKSKQAWVLGYTSSSKRVFHHFLFQLSEKGHREVIDIKPILLFSEGDSCLNYIVHCFQGFLQVGNCSTAEIMKAAGIPEKPAKAQKRKQTVKIPSSKSVPCGNIAIHQIETLEVGPSNALIAIFYRDFRFNFSIRYYQIDFQDTRAMLGEQFEEFEEPPTLIIPHANNGLLVLSPLHIFYFAPRGSIINLQEISDSLMLSSDSGRQLAVKRFQNNTAEDVASRQFTSYCIIDPKRILLVSSRGSTFMLHLDLSIIGRRIDFNSISFLDLGQSTIPNNIHYLYSNIFFASSKLSESLLFQVLPEKPYINICQNLPSSPPVLSLFTGESSIQQILTCAGGYDSGKFSDVGGTSMISNLVKRFNCKFSVFQLELIESVDGNYIIETKDIDSQPNGHIKIQLSEVNNDIKLENLKVEQEPKSSKAESRNTNFQSAHKPKRKMVNDVIVSIMENTLIFQNSKGIVIRSVSLEIPFEAFDFDIVALSHGAHCLLLLSWNGEFRLIYLSEGKQEVIGGSEIVIPDHLLSGVIIEKDLLWVLISTSSGSIMQFAFKPVDVQKTVTLEKSYSNFISKIPCKLIKNRNSDVIAYYKDTMIAASFDDVSRFFKFGYIKSTCEDLSEVLYLTDSLLLVLSGTNNLELCSLKNMTAKSVSTIYSNICYLKALPIPSTDLAVLLCFDTRLDETEGSVKYFCIKLVNTTQMLILDSYTLRPEETDITDICMIPQEISYRHPLSFILLDNSPQKQGFSIFFNIENLKFVRLPDAETSGIYDYAALSFSNITYAKKSYFIISGNFIFAARLSHNFDQNKFKWEIMTDSISASPMYSVCAKWIGQKLIFGDVLKGFFEWDVTTHASKKIGLERTPQFLTSFDVYNRLSTERILIFGDVLGNLSAVKFNDQEEDVSQSAYFNLGDQVNVVKTICTPRSLLNDDHISADSVGKKILRPVALIGTVHGALYTLYDFVGIDEDTFRIFEKCYNEISDASFIGNQDRESDLNQSPSIKKWNLLSRDETGAVEQIDSSGIFDISLIKRWLSQCDNVSTDNTSKSRRKKKIPKEPSCSFSREHKLLLQQLIYESEIF
ncbi:Piso0_004151 [Millerozyma farinosa CBS 7064]|uniref:Piso0_004151 protein n=1 Tax=Pichia sorbitophila (strain ATCC MYA-4447 / BCRC 22081 / CBS 7064 / NBRC 10061 / NRRL Y-12695) TaxID=559304 RepID=G8Y7M2_PICSO|nr:Piso0_004151 [Millerozyma farinosa CBS 7064]CCE84602.1 Piso0_004151 [Millerozyma farinosa CBS 7064]